MKENNNDEESGVFSDSLGDESEQHTWLLQRESYDRLKALTPVQFYQSVKTHIAKNSAKFPSVIKDILNIFQSKGHLNLWEVPVARRIFFNNMDNLQDYIFKEDIVDEMIRSFNPRYFNCLDDAFNKMDVDTVIAFHKDKVNNYSNYSLPMLDYFYAKNDTTLAQFFISKTKELQEIFLKDGYVPHYVADYVLANFPEQKNSFNTMEDGLNILIVKSNELKAKFNLHDSNLKKPKP